MFRYGIADSCARISGSIQPVPHPRRRTGIFAAGTGDAVGEGLTTFGDHLVAETSECMGVWDSAVSAMGERKGVEPLSADEARAHYWRFAAMTDTEVPQPRPITPQAAENALAQAGAHGIDRLIRDYEDDNIGSPSAESLFAPFGGVRGTTDAQREAVIDVLSRNAGHSDRIWRLAMDQAQR